MYFLISKLSKLKILNPQLEFFLISLLNKIITSDIFFESCFSNQRIFPVDQFSKIQIKISRILACCEDLDFNDEDYFLCLKAPNTVTLGCTTDDDFDFNTFRFFRWRSRDQMVRFAFQKKGFYTVYLLQNSIGMLVILGDWRRIV